MKSFSRSAAAPAARTEALTELGRTAAYLILCALVVSPLLWVNVPALVDYPNHLARMWILVHDGEIAELAQNYIADWRLLPNLAMDLVVPALAHAMPVEVAGRVFIALTMLGLVAGTAALHRALHGRVGLWPLCALLFVYNTALYWGFLNFLFGVGLYLLAFSGWIASRDWPLARRVAIFAVVSALLLIAHLFAFGLYALSVSSYEFALAGRWPTIAGLRRWVTSCLQFLPSLGLLVPSLSKTGPSLTAFGGLGDKFYAMLAPATFGKWSVPLDLVIVCLAFFLLYAAIRSRALTLAPGMRLPLCALGLGALLMPNTLSGSWAADIRLPVTLPFVIIAATRLDIGRQRAIALASVAFVLLAARVWTVSQTWRDYDDRFAEFRTAARVIPPGSRLLVVELPLSDADRAIPGIPAALSLRADTNFDHMPALAVIDRSAFYPYLFTGWTTIRPAARNAGLFQTQGHPVTPELLADSVTREQMGPLATAPNAYGELPYWVAWPKSFDFVLWIDFERRPPPDLGLLQLAAEGTFFQIYRVSRH